MAGGKRKRKIKLCCRSVKKTARLEVWEEERLDLGSIARTFGIDPSTLKLNGHFISRGFDFIASSVTWKSLLSFFSARGLSTGEDDYHAPLVVDGNPCKPPTKRHDPQDVESESHFTIEQEHEVSGVNRRPQLGVTNLIKKRKLSEGESGPEDGSLQVANTGCIGLKRKLWSEDLIPLKKLKINETNLATLPKDLQGTDSFGNNSKTHFTCSYMSQNMKRMREDEVNPDCSLQKDQSMRMLLFE